jgi:hypothetical protein
MITGCLILWPLLPACSSEEEARKYVVDLVKTEQGMKLVMNGEDFMINGMNWDFYPIGTNYTYNLWDQPAEFIREALDGEMSLLKELGVNAIRQYAGVPPEWIAYIYDQYGIHTVINHTFGRYGLTVDGQWVARTDYGDSLTREILIDEVKVLAENYKGTPGLLLYLLGNENNYGLFWEGAETEDIPVEDSVSAVRARHLYNLFNRAANTVREIDPERPIAICNGDLQFLDIIAEECTDIDILGTNMYRGVSFQDVEKDISAFQEVKEVLDYPILFTEFGSDAYNAVEDSEDQLAQAYYLVGNWKEIYENVAGLGRAGNSLGGLTFQFSDGWWKYRQTENLDVHDTHASWSNGGYDFDYSEGENNMNEEWFGICAKGETDEWGMYPLYPRAAYFVLQEIHAINPYAEAVTLQSIDDHFKGILLEDALKKVKHAVPAPVD